LFFKKARKPAGRKEKRWVKNREKNNKTENSIFTPPGKSDSIELCVKQKSTPLVFGILSL
jgi:hypothetical protein